MNDVELPPIEIDGKLWHARLCGPAKEPPHARITPTTKMTTTHLAMVISAMPEQEQRALVEAILKDWKSRYERGEWKHKTK